MPAVVHTGFTVEPSGYALLMRVTGGTLSAYQGTVSWKPGALDIAGVSGPRDAAVGAINQNDAGNGVLHFAFAALDRFQDAEMPDGLRALTIATTSRVRLAVSFTDVQTTPGTPEVLVAALSEQDRTQITAALQRRWSNITERCQFSGPQLKAAVDAIDAWIESNAATINAALPAAFRTGATAEQKALLFSYVALKRFGDSPKEG